MHIPSATAAFIWQPPPESLEAKCIVGSTLTEIVSGGKSFNTRDRVQGIVRGEALELLGRRHPIWIEMECESQFLCVHIMRHWFGSLSQSSLSISLKHPLHMLNICKCWKRVTCQFPGCSEGIFFFFVKRNTVISSIVHPNCCSWKKKKKNLLAICSQHMVQIPVVVHVFSLS